MTKIGVFGANGRMGQALIEAVEIEKEAQLAAAFVRSSSPFLDTPVRALQPAHSSELAFADEEGGVERAEVLIDFTLPQGMLTHLQSAVESKIPMVIGTTGLTEAEMDQLREAAKTIPIVFARNFSVGVNLLLNLVQTAATKLADEMDIEIFEAHHRNKIDAPSGTALAIGEAIAEAKGWDHDEVARYDRSNVHEAKSQDEIGYSVLRAGDIVGEHTAYFATMGERLELTHKAASRLTFASGAVRAAQWLKNKPVGLYDMQDVLGLK
ncbi:dihydrodipicolinate reductase [Pseudoalteromonas luteoviolacea CPMOR-2]|uniref:4-hydroxy-tetrahydrodipicolinate reductase n=1 Tax=Pseudoalteromonas luteoviolacea DSM 6061 TaxID=1365250 RepID=A0A162A2U8_9GAMM|nr:4-hydroxy-tetrahydrodipicolinate reductase [Pseudoalteromonas luteoviolacea]KZN43019.1 dihydrodipicolinate reductase [Pseudoalteromonas luteoviolacea DSM 6061]KZN55423.1 dihydrodipicolinate reductase [Pseudoalteromonas luteoviolacea CPMOR-2]MBE0385526.1 4-hydroxy-tetrahydrodipicolinate reductase [Pseudoalteromonas luteoviolacea DSM 6061]